MINSIAKYKIFFILLLLAFLIIGVSYMTYVHLNVPQKPITSFEECSQAGYPIMQSYPPQCKAPNGTTFISSVPDYEWNTFSDQIMGIRFQYPKDFLTKYIHTVDWPPKVTITGGPLTCTQGGSEVMQAGKTEKQTIGGNVYCLTRESEGAAGSIYTTYMYATEKNNKVVILTFTTRSVQCMNYDNPQQTECLNERATFNIDDIANRIMSTFEFVPTISNKTGSGISGTVFLGPTCPVMRIPPDPQCADKPYKTNLVVMTSDQSKVVKEFSSDDNGKFIVDVPPGEYHIQSSALSNILPRCGSSENITVASGSYASTTISCDTGIR